MKTAVKLPDNLPDLIELAVRDAIKCEEDPEYQLEMGEWHCPTEDACRVCMAGAVMAKTLLIPAEWMTPSMFADADTSKKLWIIEHARTGDLERAGFLDGIKSEAVGAASKLITDALDRELDRAPWPVYLEAARILREGARVEALESREPR